MDENLVAGGQFDESGTESDRRPEGELQPEREAEGAPNPGTDGVGDTSSGIGDLEEEPVRVPRLRGTGKGRRLVRKTDQQNQQPDIGADQRLLLLDTWRRSGLPATDFAVLVGISKHTLYLWHKRFQAEGPAGLVDRPRGGPKGSKLPDLTKRTILMLKASHPELGCERISDMLWRGPALPASPSAVARVLHEAGYELEESPTRPHPPAARRFERAKPNELWQTDLFTFMLKRQNRRVYLVAFMDDHSRFITSFGLHATQSAPLVIEVLRAGITAYGAPQEILTDNGAQYVTWRGKSAFTKELEKRGIRQIVASPRRPQTLGKIERFWGTLWREFLETAVFLDLEDARRRIGWFMDGYNFRRTHEGIEGLVPADRFFGAAPEVLRSLRARVAENAMELARSGVPKRPFYLTGQVAGKSFSIHTAGERVILTDGSGNQQEIELVGPNQQAGGSQSGSAGEPPAPRTDAVPRQESAEVADPLAPAADALPGEPAASAELPEVLCPDGSPPEGLTDSSSAEPPVPGVSPLDDAMRQIREAMDGNADTEGGAL